MTVPRFTPRARGMKIVAWTSALLLVTATGLYVTAGFAAAPEGGVRLSIGHAAPRQVEQQTERAIIRDYGAAWMALGDALQNNRPEQLGDLWTGFARQQLVDAIQQQKQSGLRTRYLDNSHDLQAVFYSPEGSALELRDTAQVEQQVLDGNTVVSSQDLTVHYLVVMTPTADHWQVRILQSVPGF